MSFGNSAWYCLLVLISLLTVSAICSVTSKCKDVDVGSPAKARLGSEDFKLLEFSPGATHSPRSIILCERVCIHGIPRTFENIKKISHIYRVMVQQQSAARVYPQICFHRNESLPLGQCLEGEWLRFQNGLWSGTMSPYETAYIDIRVTRPQASDHNNKMVDITVSFEVELQLYRLIFLAMGMVMMMLAPILSRWLPFYYGTTMTLGIVFAILIVIFQTRKLIPVRVESTVRLFIFGSMIGVGSLVKSYFADQPLGKLGLHNVELYNAVAIIIVACIVLAGAGAGLWTLKKFVLSDDGSIDLETGQFVKWVIRILAALMILQSSADALFAVLALIAGIALTAATELVSSTSIRRSRPKELLLQKMQKKGSLKSVVSSLPCNLSREDIDELFKPYRGPSQLRFHETTEPPITDYRDYYSTFHKMPEMKKLSKEEWEAFTESFTRNAMRELASMAEFSYWVIENAYRVRTKGSPKDPKGSPQES